MNQSIISYTVGIKRRFLPLFKRYSVTGHDTDSGCLLLNLTDGSQLSVPGVTQKVIKVYPDYRNAEIQLAKLRKRDVQPNPPPVPVTDDEFEAMLQQRRAAQAGG